MSHPDQPTPKDNNPLDSDYKESRYDLQQIHGSVLRELDDPEDGYEPLPLWLITFFFIIMFWGGGYLFAYSGGFRPDVFDTQMVPASMAKSAADQGPPDPIANGKKVFTRNCAACHQASGLGMPGQYPPLAGSEIVLGLEKYGENHLGLILLHGLNGPVEVLGKTYNGNMPNWNTQLTDTQIAHVLTYIRQEWGNSAGPISEEGIASLRKEFESRKVPWTYAELMANPASPLAAAPAAPAQPEPAPAP